MKKIITNNVNETKKTAFDFAKKLKNGDIILLKGDLGVGKTVFAKSICDFFGVENEVTSPTFTILKSYNTKKIKINHFDLYRINTTNQLSEIGFEDVIYEKNSICLVEWPEIAIQILPKNIITVEIKKIDNSKREICIH